MRPTRVAARHPGRRATVALALALALPPAARAAPDEPDGETFRRAFSACHYKTDTIARLRCYDALVPPGGMAPPAADVIVDERVAANTAVDEEERQTRVDRLAWLSRRDEQGMLTADDPNYFVYAHPVDDDLEDESHGEFYVSLKYPLADDQFSAWQDAFKRWESPAGRFLNGITPDRLLLHYNGLYDLYIDSDRYESAPVISRRQNPGASVEYDFARGRDTLRIGWFHESNGQSLEAGDEEQFRSAQARFGDDFALADVSRGWDYALLRWTSTALRYEDPLQVARDGQGLGDLLSYHIEARLYCDCQALGYFDGREDDIWWEEGNGARITDYDGLRLRAEHPLYRRDNFYLNARLDLKTGLEHSTGQYWSSRLTLGANWDNLRLTAFYFDGYGRDPSTYHLRTRYAGLGFELR